MSTSTAKALANRRNATLSTGPRTLAGKLASSRNAQRRARKSKRTHASIERAEATKAGREVTGRLLPPSNAVCYPPLTRFATPLYEGSPVGFPHTYDENPATERNGSVLPPVGRPARGGRPPDGKGEP